MTKYYWILFYNEIGNKDIWTIGMCWSKTDTSEKFWKVIGLGNMILSTDPRFVEVGDEILKP